MRGEEPAAHPVVQEGTTIYAGPRAFFRKLEQYWGDLMNEREQEGDDFLKWMDETSSEGLPHDVGVLCAAAREMPQHTCAGLDCWPVGVLRNMTAEIASVLIRIFQRIERVGRWPTQLSEGRVQLLPKPGQPPTPAGLRPITIVSTWVRLWSRYRLKMLDPSVLMKLHPSLRGGIPGRDATQQIGEILNRIEEVWAGAEGGGHAYLLTIDASKCFDRIERCSALGAASALGIPKTLLRALGMFWRQLERRFSVGGFLSSSVVTAANGLPQGDPLSVLLTNCVVEGWVRMLSPLDARLCAYIDDRTVLTTSEAQMREAWSLTHRWEKQEHWQMNVGKSAIGHVGKGAGPILEHGGQVLPEVEVMKLLGVEVLLDSRRGGGLQTKRTEKAYNSCERVRILSLGFRAARALLQIAVLPQWRYAMHAKPVPKAQVAKMTQGIKMGLNLSGKLHCWWVVGGVLNLPHKLDPWTYSVHTHVRCYLKGLRASEEVRNWLVASQRREPTRRPRGPTQCFLAYARECGIQIEGLSLVYGDSECHLVESKMSKILQMWVRAFRDRCIRGAVQARRAYEGLRETNISVSVQRVLRKISPYRKEIVGLMSDAIWTRHRKKVAGLLEDEICVFCDGGQPETVQHILYECPRWRRFHGAFQEKLGPLRENPSACSKCLFYLPGCGLSPREWGEWQESCARVIREWGCRTREREEKGQQESPTIITWPCIPNFKGKQLNFALTYSLNSTAGQWPSTRAQWHRATHFVSRIHHDPQSGFRCTVLELYLSYLVCNGMRRWVSGVAEAAGGNRISNQMERFRTAMVVFQNLTGVSALVPDTHVGGEVVGWGKGLGFRDLLLVPTPGILPPRLEEARSLLDAVPYLVAEIRAQSNPGIDAWRRWEPGIAHSQMGDRGGSLPCIPLVGGVGDVYGAVRVRAKTYLPLWAQQRILATKLRKSIVACPAGNVVDEKGHSLGEHLCEWGIITIEDVRTYAKAMRGLEGRCRRVLMHLESLLGGASGHVIEINESQRMVCVVCQHASAAGDRTWFKRECPTPATRERIQSAMCAVQRHLIHIGWALPAVARLLHCLH